MPFCIWVSQTQITTLIQDSIYLFHFFSSILLNKCSIINDNIRNTNIDLSMEFILSLCCFVLQKIFSCFVFLYFDKIGEGEFIDQIFKSQTAFYSHRIKWNEMAKEKKIKKTKQNIYSVTFTLETWSYIYYITFHLDCVFYLMGKKYVLSKCCCYWDEIQYVDHIQ